MERELRYYYGPETVVLHLPDGQVWLFGGRDRFTLQEVPVGDPPPPAIEEISRAETFPTPGISFAGWRKVDLAPGKRVEVEVAPGAEAGPGESPPTPGKTD